MQKPYFSLSILILTSLLAGCAPRAAVPPAEARALEHPRPTDMPEKATEAASQPEILPHDPPASCPITVPQKPLFSAPEPYSPQSPFESNFWHGSNTLWTDLPRDGIWYALPHNPGGYTQKIFWWSELFSWNDEPQPALVVTGERLDKEAPALQVSRATNASAGDIGTAMLVGVDFPTLGCWKITGQYKKSELSFVVWVAP